VLLADVEVPAAEQLAAEVTGQGSRAAALGADVSQVSNARALVQQAVLAFGRLDILVNNAGIFPFAAALKLGEEHWDHVVGDNLKGAFICAQAAAAQMSAEGHGGRIVNLASGDTLRPSDNLAPYVATKGGILALTRALVLAVHHRR
jgi:2-deoxy-D-gluconate 3-dehydrogenase